MDRWQCCNERMEMLRELTFLYLLFFFFNIKIYDDIIDMICSGGTHDRAISKRNVVHLDFDWKPFITDYFHFINHLNDYYIQWKFQTQYSSHHHSAYAFLIPVLLEKFHQKLGAASYPADIYTICICVRVWLANFFPLNLIRSMPLMLGN